MLTKEDLGAIEKVIDKKLAPVTSKIDTIQKDIVQIRSDQKAIISFFD